MDSALRRRGSSPLGTAVVELSLFLLLLFLWLAGLAHVGLLARHRLDLERFLALAPPDGFSALSPAQRQQLLRTASDFSPPQLTLLPSAAIPSLSGGEEGGPALFRGPLRLLLLQEERQAARVAAPAFMSHLLDLPSSARWENTIYWDRDPLAQSPRLRAALWGVALASAGVDLGSLQRALADLGKAGRGHGGETIPSAGGSVE